MSSHTWRNIALVLAALSVYLFWRGPRVITAAATTTAAQKAAAPAPVRVASWDEDDSGDPGSTTTTSTSTSTTTTDDSINGNVGGFGFSVPGWAKWFLPEPGEDMVAYKDRVLPFVQAAVAPQRTRVAAARDDFAAAAHLDARQKAELDAACSDASDKIEERVTQSLMSGELMPNQVKPTTAVSLARDILDDVDGADRRFEASLTDDQRAALAEHPFDVADYLLFSTRWEDLINSLMPSAEPP